MSAIYILVAVSLLLGFVFVAAFLISIKSGQYNDSYTPSVRILFDNKPNKTK